MAIVVYHVMLDELEVEGFFNEEGILLHSWHMNDAEYRPEYMDPLLKALGVKIKFSNTNKQLQALRDAYK